MDIVISFDENYVMPAGVMLTSLFENNKEANIHIHALLRRGGEFSQPIVDIVNKYGGKITCYDMSLYKLPYLPTGLKHQRQSLSIETYFRLFISDILSPDIDKVLWLDCDIIIADSLDELWNEDISDFPVGVIPDYENNNVQMTNKLGYNSIYGYFNGGVLLINLKYWREECIIDSFVEYISSHIDVLNYCDQDVLNHEFYSRKKELNLRYNFSTTFLFKYLNIGCQYFDMLNQAYHNPAVIHFTEDKPWFSNSTNPMKHYYLYYLDKTIWKGKNKGRRKESWKNRLYYFLIKVRHKNWSWAKSVYNPIYLNN